MERPAHGGARRNRLARESSPYLLLHADNPVDWYPWGPEALERARREDRPIFLSIGYSTCYWCHVMERESFSDPEIAKAINESFVAIKVDREERPDIDEIYMVATQVITRSGGWPNSVFLTPDLKPFFAATYLPPRDAGGRPGLPRVLAALREAWGLRRGEVLAQAGAVAETLRAHVQAGARGTDHVPRADVAGDATAALAARFDPTYGGFGRAPKFPSPPNLFFLLDRAQQSDSGAGRMLGRTLSAMAAGGIRDQLAGGFHRYSTDDRWLVPHFEKMLYDNVALAELYAEAHALFPHEGFDAVARETLGFVLREMTGPDGELYSAIDAETEGHEGAYYVWSAEELRGVLGEDDARALAPLLGFDGDPFFEGTHYVLHQSRDIAEWAAASGCTEAELLVRLGRGREQLLAARARRARPLTDDKVLADWNGLGIAALARVGALLQEGTFLRAAQRAASFLLGRMRGPAGLLHVARDGRAWVAAFLDDHAFVVRGLLALHAATGELRWLEAAVELAHEQEARLSDAETGAYFNAPVDTALWLRSRQSPDGAVVSGSGVSAQNLLELAARTGETAWRTRAERLLRAHGDAVEAQPLAHLTLVRASVRFHASADASSMAVTAARPGTRPSMDEDLEDQARGVVEITAKMESGPGEWREFTLELSVHRGWHLYAAEPGQAGVTSTTVKPVLGGLRSLRYAEGVVAGSAALPIRVYRDRVVIRGEIEPPAGGAPSVELAYQACDDERCLPPVTRVVRIS